MRMTDEAIDRFRELHCNDILRDIAGERYDRRDPESTIEKLTEDEIRRFLVECELLRRGAIR